MLESLQVPVTQEVFGRLVGVTQSAISQLVTRGVLKPGDSAQAWLLAYCERLREEAAGRAMTELSSERAALARSQREAQEMKNAQARGELAPIALLADVLATASAALSNRLEGIEPLLSKVAPDLPDEGKAALLKMITAARNEWVKATLQLIEEALPADDLDDGQSDAEPGAPTP
jgi:phage terminase Nu1 subunit (DNA packaging protein)